MNKLLLILLTISMYTMLSTTKHQNIPYLVLVYSTHAGSATASLGFGNIAQENTTADILTDILMDLLKDMITVYHMQELYKP